MNRGDIQKLVIFSIAFVLFLFCIIGAHWILPENCSLFERRNNGFACDGIDVTNPKPCLVCENYTIVSIGEILFYLGFGFLFLPFIVYGIKSWQNHSANQTKLLD